jgi:hypothetical protein
MKAAASAGTAKGNSAFRGPVARGLSVHPWHLKELLRCGFPVADPAASFTEGASTAGASAMVDPGEIVSEVFRGRTAHS